MSSLDPLGFRTFLMPLWMFSCLILCRTSVPPKHPQSRLSLMASCKALFKKACVKHHFLFLPHSRFSFFFPCRSDLALRRGSEPVIIEQPEQCPCNSFKLSRIPRHSGRSPTVTHISQEPLSTHRVPPSTLPPSHSVTHTHMHMFSLHTCEAENFSSSRTVTVIPSHRRSNANAFNKKILKYINT